MATNFRWLFWMLICVLSLACFGAVSAQEPNGVKIGQSDPLFKPGSGSSEVRAMLQKLSVAVGVLLVLGGGAIYLMRVILPKFGPVSKKRIKVVEMHYLGGRKVVHLIEVGHRQLLVGSTPTQISMLADVTQHWDEVEELVPFNEAGDKS